MEKFAQVSTAMIVIDGTAPAEAGTGAAGMARQLVPDTTQWTVMVVVEEHPVLTSGATGFAAPVLSPEEMESRMRADRVAADAITASVARALGERPVRQVVDRGAVGESVDRQLEQQSCDIVVASADVAEQLTGHGVPIVLAFPEAAAVDLTGPILVAVDDSPLDERIVDAMATLCGADPEILTLHVAPTVPPGVSTTAFGTVGVAAPTVLDDALADDAERTALEAASPSRFRDVTPLGAVGDPVDRILDTADEHRVSVVVLGSRDRNWFSKLLRPSVSDAVRRRTDRPILVIR